MAYRAASPTPARVFVSELTHEQRRALLALARQTVDADGRLALGEVERLDRLYDEAGLPPEGYGAPSGAADLNLLFPESRARAVVVLELLLVGYADGELDRREAEAIRGVAERLGLPEAAWQEVSDWARRYHGLMDEARRLGEG